MTYQLIETKTLGSNAALIEFTSIPSDGTDLLLLLALRTDRNLQGDGFFTRFNGVGTGYSHRRIIGDGASVSSDTGIGSSITNAATSTANTFGNASLYIPNYAGNTNKSFSNEGVSENNATTAFMGLNASLWANTAAISSIQISPEVGSVFLTGSTISLYKITRGSSNGVVVS